MNDANKWKCAHCDCTFRTRKLMFDHVNLKHKDEKGKTSKLTENNGYCKYCGKSFIGLPKYVLTNHELHYCDKNPNKIALDYTKMRNTCRSKEYRKKASERTVFNHFWEYRNKNPIIYKSHKNFIKLDSLWELSVAEHLDKLKIEWYKPNYSLIYFDNNSIQRKYFPDFFLPKYRCFIEVKSKFISKGQNENGKIDYLKHNYNCIFWIENEEDCSSFSIKDIITKTIPITKKESDEILDITKDYYALHNKSINSYKYRLNKHNLKIFKKSVKKFNFKNLNDNIYTKKQFLKNYKKYLKENFKLVLSIEKIHYYFFKYFKDKYLKYLAKLDKKLKVQRKHKIIIINRSKHESIYTEKHVKFIKLMEQVDLENITFGYLRDLKNYLDSQGLVLSKNTIHRWLANDFSKLYNKIKHHQRGSSNSQFGKHWYTNGKTNLSCFDNAVPKGYRRGRVIKK